MKTYPISIGVREGGNEEKGMIAAHCFFINGQNLDNFYSKRGHFSCNLLKPATHENYPLTKILFVSVCSALQGYVRPETLREINEHTVSRVRPEERAKGAICPRRG